MAWINANGEMHEGDRQWGEWEATEAEVAAYNAKRLSAEFATQAKSALARSDIVAIRCHKYGVPYPQEWIVYDELLRGIVEGSVVESIPDQPPYPEGTGTCHSK